MYIALVAFMLITGQNIKAQNIDESLVKYKNDICLFLINEKEIDTTLDVEKYIYSNIIKSFLNDKIVYYRIGITSSHARKYLAVVCENKLHIYKTDDFNQEFKEIFKYLIYKGNLLSTEELFDLILEIKYMYDYNNDLSNFNMIR